MNLKNCMFLAASLAAMDLVHGAAVTLTATDPAGSSSFNAAGKWSDAAAPSAANDYTVGVQWLRTPASAFTGTFGGNSLTLTSTGGILYKGTGTAGVITVNNMILNGGLIRSGSSNADTLILAGKITVTGTGSTINADQSPFTINSVVAGTGSFTSTGANFAATYNAANTFTGDMAVTSTSSTYKTTLSSTSTWKFVVGANGVNNKITGTGYLSLAGAFNIDLSGASQNLGDSWTLVAASTLNESYASSFTPTGFTNTDTTNTVAAGSRTWTKASGLATYTYSEATGVLSVTATLDSDGDSLADTWETTYFGSLTAQNGSGDPDGDGYTNLQEFTAGSDPTVAASTPLDINADGITDGHIFATSDAIGTSSFNTGAGWKDGLAPAAGSNYLVAINNFRAPTDAADYTFAGDKLVITTGGNLLFKGSGAITIPYLGLDGGLLNNATNAYSIVNLNGAINVSRLSEIYANNAGINVNATISGTKDLKITNNGAGRAVTFSAADNTWSGSLNVTGEFVLASTSKLNFKPTTSGTTNSVGGTGAVTFNGAFDIDLSSAATAKGSSWTLVSATTRNYDSNFTVTGFTPDGISSPNSRLWTKAVGSNYYQFNEATGVLSVIDPDNDGDGLSDSWELANFGTLDYNGLDDPDGDGASNEQEETAGTNPNSASSWPDADADGLKDAWEVQNFGSITAQNASGDPDGDLATNLQEFQAGTDPNSASYFPDSDGDGMNDAWEVKYFGNLSHNGFSDSDGDGYTDAEEFAAHTNPTSNTSSPLKAALLHRWSFNGNLTDTVGNSNATIIDVGANDVAYDSTTSPTKITMTGGAKDSSDYIKLGSNLVPKNTEPFTLELWAKQEGVQNWSRIFDFNSSTSEYLMMSWTTGTNAATDRLDFVDSVQGTNGSANTSFYVDNKNQWGTANEYHIILEVKPLAGSDGTTKVTVYSAPSSATTMGAAKFSGETRINLVNFNDTLDALGYSPWPDNTANATYNEVRMWSGNLTSYVRDLLQTQGPDTITITDTDADSLPDSWELKYATNLTTLTQAGDNDGDGYSNRDEYLAGSNPLSATSTPLDTDADGLPDEWEISYFGSITAQGAAGDPDNDGFTNLQEYQNGTDPTSGDNDRDGMLDSWEIQYFGDLSHDGSADTDGDGYSDLAEYTGASDPTNVISVPGDFDGDGLLDTWEIQYFGNITAQNGSGDPDGDGYTNEQEETAASDPTKYFSSPDEDADGLPDSWEKYYFGSITTYNSSSDPDGDGLSNLAEYAAGTDPTSASSYKAALGYWRFEEATSGDVPSGGNGAYAYPTQIKDSSGYGNNMMGWATYSVPAYSTTIPTATIPSTGAANTASLLFTRNNDGQYFIDAVFTTDTTRQTAPGGFIRTYPFSALTVECSFNAAATGLWQVPVCRMGNPVAGQPPFSIKIDTSNKLRAGLVDGSKTAREIIGTTTITAATWYNAVVTVSATEMKLWLKTSTSPNYTLEGTVAVSGAWYGSLGDGVWNVGGGQWNGTATDAFGGNIDEVRVSARVLSSTEYLFPESANNYSTWATANGIGGVDSSVDSDHDGLINLMEYALGLNPLASNGTPGTMTGNVVSYTKGADAVANGDVTYAIQTSTDLTTWTTVTPTTDTASAISYTLPTGQSKIFARLVVTAK